MSATSSNFAFGVRVPYDHTTAIARVRETLKAEGFGILTEIDVQRTLKEKLDHEMGKYVILGACNPNLARQGLAAEIELGALLPCNIVVYVDPMHPGETVVVAQNPDLMHSLVGNDALKPLADEARARIERALAALGGRPR